jgi:hypothetical protein
MGGGWRIWRLSWLIAWLFWLHFVASIAWVLQTLVHCSDRYFSDSYVRMHHFVCRSTFIFFRRFVGDVQREFVRLFGTLHDTLGSHLRDALQEEGVYAVACLRVPRA